MLMATIHPKFVVDENAVRQGVLLSLKEWRQILDELEELDDIRAYDAAKSEPQDAIPFEQAVRELNGNE